MAKNSKERQSLSILTSQDLTSDLGSYGLPCRGFATSDNWANNVEILQTLSRGMITMAENVNEHIKKPDDRSDRLISNMQQLERNWVPHFLKQRQCQTSIRLVLVLGQNTPRPHSPHTTCLQKHTQAPFTTHNVSPETHPSPIHHTQRVSRNIPRPHSPHTTCLQKHN